MTALPISLDPRCSQEAVLLASESPAHRRETRNQRRLRRHRERVAERLAAFKRDRTRRDDADDDAEKGRVVRKRVKGNFQMDIKEVEDPKEVALRAAIPTAVPSSPTSLLNPLALDFIPAPPAFDTDPVPSASAAIDPNLVPAAPAATFFNAALAAMPPPGLGVYTVDPRPKRSRGSRRT
ncbi:hypothetical protein HK101_002727 [Irineochytrium annulatum]|nr:hypothetical protein HK101_002727 [Irineochytrium annulatum]